MSNRSGRRNTGGPPKKHRAVHLSDLTYAKARAMAEGQSFSSWVESVIEKLYAKRTMDEEE